MVQRGPWEHGRQWNHKWRLCSSLSLISMILFILNSFHKTKQSTNLLCRNFETVTWSLHRKRPQFWPSIWILHYDNAPVHKALSVRQFLAQNLITELECTPCSPYLAPNYFWPFRKTKSALKRWRYPKKCDDSTESYSTTGVPKTFPAVAASLS